MNAMEVPTIDSFLDLDQLTPSPSVSDLNSETLPFDRSLESGIPSLVESPAPFYISNLLRTDLYVVRCWFVISA